MSKKVKIKTHRGAKKRFRKTANGVKCRSAKTRHMRVNQSTKRKRQARNGQMLPDAELGRVEQMLPND